MAVERTTNPYATYGPSDTGESWAEYFQRIKRGVGVGDAPSSDESDVGADSTSEPTDGKFQLQHSNRDGIADLDDPPAALIRYHKLLIKNDFDIRLGWYRQFAEGRIYGAGAAKAGERAPDRTLDTVLIAAYKPHRLVKMSYERTNGGKWSCAWRQLNLQLVPVSDKQMKDWINDKETRG